jgi:hypothetical protein
MMSFLVPHVASDRRNLRFADGECCIASLPGETTDATWSFIGPFRRVGLDESHHLRDRYVSLKLHDDMNVVFDATDLEQLAPFAPNDAADVFVESVARAGIRMGLRCFVAKTL